MKCFLVYIAVSIFCLFFTSCHGFISNKRSIFRLKGVNSLMHKDKFPYGPSDWLKLRKNSEFVVDKTHAIAELERQGSCLRFFRPTRFGKSLLCSQLKLYYDITTSDEMVSEKLSSPTLYYASLTFYSVY